MKRPYRIVTYAASGYFLDVKKYCCGTYTSLSNAIAAAKRKDSAVPDETRCIFFAGKKVRDQYNHGPVRSWTSD